MFTTETVLASTPNDNNNSSFVLYKNLTHFIPQHTSFDNTLHLMAFLVGLLIFHLAQSHSPGCQKPTVVFAELLNVLWPFGYVPSSGECEKWPSMHLGIHIMG